VTNATEFAEFASAASPRLRRMAFLLCGNWHTAEDLTQTALAKVFASWPRVRRQEAVHAYTHPDAGQHLPGGPAAAAQRGDPH
jgi:DNA-directed RNA polymerase specialized sigma subunit, sigma24 homolog